MSGRRWGFCLVVPRAPGGVRRRPHVRLLPQGHPRRAGAAREPHRARRRLDARARQPCVLRARALRDVPRGQVLRRLPRAHDPRPPREASVRRHAPRGGAPRRLMSPGTRSRPGRSPASARPATRRATSARAATRRAASTSRRAGRARTRPAGSACADNRTTTGRRRGETRPSARRATRARARASASGATASGGLAETRTGRDGRARCGRRLTSHAGLAMSEGAS